MVRTKWSRGDQGPDLIGCLAQLACQVAEAGRRKPLLLRGYSESVGRVAAVVVLTQPRQQRGSSAAAGALRQVMGKRACGVGYLLCLLYCNMFR